MADERVGIQFPARMMIAGYNTWCNCKKINDDFQAFCMFTSFIATCAKITDFEPPKEIKELAKKAMDSITEEDLKVTDEELRNFNEEDFLND